jgi:hypothetical protein
MKTQYCFTLFLSTLLLLQTACGQPVSNPKNTSKQAQVEALTGISNHPYYSRTDTGKLVLDDSIWKRILRESTGTPRIKVPTFALLVVTNYLDQMQNSKVAAGGLVFTNK